MRKNSIILSIVMLTGIFLYSCGMGGHTAHHSDKHEGHDNIEVADDSKAFPGKSVLTHEREEALGKIINAYLKIRSALSKDSLNGVDTNARKIAEGADKTGSEIKAMKTAHDKYTHKLHSLLDKTAKHAGKLHGSDIEEVRKQFISLSTNIFDIVKIYGKPHNVKADALYGYYCAMYPGYWIQEDKNVGNPFYGSRMLKCADSAGDSKTKIHYYSKSKKQMNHGKTEHMEMKREHRM